MLSVYIYACCQNDKQQAHQQLPCVDLRGSELFIYNRGDGLTQNTP